MRKKTGKLVQDVAERIGGDPIDMDLVVQMRACGPAGITYGGDLLAPLYDLSVLDQILIQMGINALQP